MIGQPGQTAPVDELRAALFALRQPKAAQRAAAPRASVHGRAARAAPADVGPGAPRASLLGRFRSAEADAVLRGTSLVLAVVPERGPVSAALLRALSVCVQAGGNALVLGPDVPRDVPLGLDVGRGAVDRPLTVPLRLDDPLDQEWALIAAGPRRRVAFTARLREPGVDLWDWSLSRDPVAVQRAGSAILERVPFLRLRFPLLEH